MLAILARDIPAETGNEKITSAKKKTTLRKSPRFAALEKSISAQAKLSKLATAPPAEESLDDSSAASSTNTDSSSSSNSSASSTSSAEVTTTSAPDLFAQCLKFLPGSAPKTHAKQWMTNIEVLLRFDNIQGVDDLPKVWKKIAEARKVQEHIVLQEACQATNIRLNLPAPIIPAAFSQVVLDLAFVYSDPNSLLYGYSCVFFWTSC